ncbi:hypothetical protein FCM35_KLT21416 [Carex littledalei]|uniref:Uncharacterized protein n=1 Tax=Carex littledalei TaxID=544730 RepID=A0A833VD67_9POAL|nr:hypothetical protein FCM35_KLT21416 [Carex littledalei]
MEILLHVHQSSNFQTPFFLDWHARGAKRYHLHLPKTKKRNRLSISRHSSLSFPLLSISRDRAFRFLATICFGLTSLRYCDLRQVRAEFQHLSLPVHAQHVAFSTAIKRFGDLFVVLILVTLATPWRKNYF